jgi:hypothetical protein
MAKQWSKCVQGRRQRRSASSAATALATVLLGSFLLGAASSSAQPADPSPAYLFNSQLENGSWESSLVLPTTATTEVLRAIPFAEVPAIAAAWAFLDGEPIWDNDDLARRVAAYLNQGLNAGALIDQLAANAEPTGGWGLIPGFTADTLTTALALDATGWISRLERPVLDDSVVIPALSALLTLQASDGGWPCVEGGDSDLYCTAYAIQGLGAFREKFFLNPQVDSGAAFLKAQLNPSGSFGPAGASEVLNTAVAALALARTQEISTEIPAIRAFLNGRIQANGSWENDPFTTALAMRALEAMRFVNYCGDGSVNQLSEVCDGENLQGATCGGLGLGTGPISCTASCTLDTSACSGPPRCGDGIVNVAGEVCDGADLGGDTCVSLGLGPGTLSCGSTCKFNTTGCTAPPRCGDGVINQTSEVCDGADLGGQTCTDVGFLGGTLACNADCTLNASSCTGVPFCGDGDINRPEEECDQLDLGGRTCNSLGLGGGNLGCTTTCKLQTAGCASSGAADPRSITLGPASPVCAGNSQTVPVSLSFPAGSVIDKVDVFLLFDDTGSFAGTVPSVTQIFSQLVTQLQTALPQVSFGFGVGRFEDYGGPATGFSSESTTGRPFILNQPIVTPDVPNFLNLINSALNRSAPGGGGDGPETTLEGLFQIATGLGFDGNGNGSRLNSGAAGAPLTQTSPGTSGDIPPFSSNVAPASGTLGGVGFRAGALHLVITAGDICSVAPFPAGSPVPTTITGAGGATVPTSALRCSNVIGSQRYGFVSNSLSTTGNTVSGAVAPLGSATVQQVVAALNALGVSVIGLAPGGVATRNPVGPSSAPSITLSALALLTGATDATGNPLVFNISGGTVPIRNAIVQAVTTAATRPRDVSLTFAGLPAGLGVTFTPSVVPNVGPGGTAAFDVTFTGDGSAILNSFRLDFVDLVSNAVLASVPVSVECLPMPPTPVDEDDDGYPEDVDCDDHNPAVNPGAEEIPGNGIDDDCNAATPDVTPLASAACQLFADKLAYSAADVATLASRVTNLTEELSLTGLSATLAIGPPGGGPLVFTESRTLPPLPPGGRNEGTFSFGAAGHAAGEYLALLTVESGTQTLTMCSVAFHIESSALTGAGLSGTLELDPTLVNAGSPSTATYTVTNGGNATLTGLGLKVLLVDPDSGQIVGQILDGATLAPGATYSAAGPFSTTGLAQKTYIAVLIAVLSSGLEQTLDTANLTVVNEAPDCDGAVAVPATVLWEPDHRFTAISITGVTDPDGDPVTTIITTVFQDEPANDIGDGATCPDAQGTGTPVVQVRAERSGKRDGRVYHIRFQAEDGRGGACTGEVTVCVPHDRRPGAACTDQGALFDSTVCQ